MRGVLYTAVAGNPIYLDWAICSAQSVKAVMPDVRVGVFTNMEDKARKSQYIDDVWSAPAVIAKEDLQGIFIEGMIQCTYDPTLFLGADSVVCEDLRPVMELMETGRFDLALTQPRQQSHRMPLRGVPDVFPNYNDGIMVFPRNATMVAFLKDWQERFNTHKVEFRKYRKRKGGMHPTQQPLWEALYYNSHLRLVVLPKEYNEQFWTGIVYGKVKVLHVHGAGCKKTWKMAKYLNADTSKPRLFRERKIL